MLFVSLCLGIVVGSSDTVTSHHSPQLWASRRGCFCGRATCEPLARRAVREIVTQTAGLRTRGRSQLCVVAPDVR